MYKKLLLFALCFSTAYAQNTGQTQSMWTMTNDEMKKCFNNDESFKDTKDEKLTDITKAINSKLESIKNIKISSIDECTNKSKDNSDLHEAFKKLSEIIPKELKTRREILKCIFNKIPSNISYKFKQKNLLTFRNGAPSCNIEEIKKKYMQ